MGIQNQTDSTTNNINMKAFVAVSALLATAAADQTHHQVIKHGNAPAVSHSVHKPHGSYAAVVASQPHAAPQDVHNPDPVYHAAPVVHKPAPVYHPAPVVHKPAPVHHPEPAYHEPAYDGPAVYQYG